ncbi:hypothetical protein O0L34_g8201 [Tuta absoluta]|nr:hypothetical protein O0L34_g8201 [Tuta absoluta]
MAAVLKKRALAEYNKKFQDGPAPKKLHLVKKPLIGSSAAAFVGLLEKCKSSDEALQLLLRISDCLQFQESDVEEAIKKLSEHFQSEEDSVVRVKILWLFCDIGLECPGANLNNLIDETIHLIKNETSHKVIAQGIATLNKLGKKLDEDKMLMMRLVGVAKDNLKDTSHNVKCRCLQLISELYPIYPEADRTSDMVTESEAIVKLLGDYSNSEDARVRCEAFQSLLTLNERGQPLNATLYDTACTALADDYEIVREVAIKLVWLLGNKYPENSVTLQDGETTIRMVDDAFIRICSAVNDLCMGVRALACSLLGATRAVSDRFLLQTLDKQLMSNMKKKRTAHERGAELVRSGAWASGRRWADDAPGKLLEQATVTLCPGGAAGAFVHGLEDELMEVRTAAVDAVCQLSLENPTFATTSLDFLVDMFNDEIEEVRLRAIDSLTQIAHHIVLREDQLETILGALEDYSMDVREGLHRMLGACTVASKTCLEMCIDKILENLKRYPQDKRSTFRCLQRMGSSHATLVLPLVTRLLAVHPFFDMPEPDVEDPAYMCVLILVLNAAAQCTTMLPLFEEHTVKHYTYLRDTMPHLVPHLPIGDAQQSSSKSEVAMDDTAVRRFFDTVFQHIDNTTLSTSVRLKMLQAAEEQLNKLAEMEPLISGAAHFTALFARCVLQLHYALHASSGPPQHALTQLTADCLRLQHQFSGVSEQEIACVWQLALRVSAARLCHAVTTTPQPTAPTTPGAATATTAAMCACAALTHHAELLDRLLAQADCSRRQVSVSGTTPHPTAPTTPGAATATTAAMCACAALTHHAELLDRLLAQAVVPPHTPLHPPRLVPPPPPPRPCVPALRSPTTPSYSTDCSRRQVSVSGTTPQPTAPPLHPPRLVPPPPPPRPCVPALRSPTTPSYSTDCSRRQVSVSGTTPHPTAPTTPGAATATTAAMCACAALTHHAELLDRLLAQAGECQWYHPTTHCTTTAPTTPGATTATTAAMCACAALTHHAELLDRLLAQAGECQWYHPTTHCTTTAPTTPGATTATTAAMCACAALTHHAELLDRLLAQAGECQWYHPTTHCTTTAPTTPGATTATTAAMCACAALTHHAELLDRLLAQAGVEPDPFTIAVFQQLSMSAENKPAALARAILPLLQSAPLPNIPKPNLKIRMCTASIVEPACDNDTIVRFSAGLIAGVALEAEVLRVKDPRAIRIRVAYPDRRHHALVPPKDHLRPLDHHNTNDDGTQNVRLLTKVLISHSVWTEPCGVDISVCLAVEEGGPREPAPLVELCKPVRVTVAPKPIKRGI